MANIRNEVSTFKFATAENQSDIEETEWFTWIRRYNQPNYYAKEQGDNFRFASGAPTAESNTEAVNEINAEVTEAAGRSSVDYLIEETTCTVGPEARPHSQDLRSQCPRNKLVNYSATIHRESKSNTSLIAENTEIKAELEKEHSFLANELSFMKDRYHVMEEKMESMKDNHKVQMLNQQVKHDRLVQQMKEDMMKAMADRNNNDESKKEEDNFIRREFRENVYLMEQKIKRIDESVLSQNHKYNKAMEILQVRPEVVSMSSANGYSELRADYEKINRQMEKLETIVTSLKSEKQILYKTIEKMAKEIKSSNRNNNLIQKEFDKFKSQTKKDVNEVKKLLYSLESTLSQAIRNAKAENIDCRKYNKLKMRLSMIERAEVANQIKVEQMRQNMTVVPSAYIRAGGVNESPANVQYEAKHQQAHSSRSVTPSPPSAPPSESPIVPSPPPFVPQPPPCGPPRPSFLSPGPQSDPSRYTINNDLLKAMSSELRKPDGNNVRRIPRRQDMRIPSKAQNNSEQGVLLPPPAVPLPVITPEATVVTTEQPTSDGMESTDSVSQTMVLETVVGQVSAVEPPAPAEFPSSSIVDSETPVVPVVAQPEIGLTTVDSEIPVVHSQFLKP